MASVSMSPQRPGTLTLGLLLMVLLREFLEASGGGVLLAAHRLGQVLRVGSLA